MSQGGHAKPFSERGWLWGPKNNMMLLSLSQGIWINSMQSICQNKCSWTCWDNITHPCFFLIGNFPDNDKMSCNSWITHTKSMHPGWYVCNWQGGGLSYIFEPWNAAVIINSPAFSYSTLVVTCHQKEKRGKKRGNHCYLSPLLAIITELFHTEEAWRGVWRDGIPKEPHIKKRDRPLIYWRQSNKYICWQLNRYLLCSLPQV